jgi:hypothetical protein
MAIEHKDIVDAQRHPPKGASTALAGQQIVSDGAGDVSWTIPEPKGADTAAAGEVYIADGAGSGTYKSVSGWKTALDSIYTSSSKLTLSGGTRHKVTIDGLAYTDGEGLDTVWDTVNNKIMAEGANYCYHMRFDFRCSTTGTTPYVDIELDGGTPLNVFLTDTKPVQKGGAVTNSIVFSTEIFADSTVAANGVEIYITPNVNMDFWNFGIFLVRSHRAYAG